VKNTTTKPVRCAIYTRVSTDHGLEQDFNSLDAQHDAAQAYIQSQAHAGWTLIRSRYDDGGYSGGSTERPALQLGRKVDVIVVYKVDRLTSFARASERLKTTRRRIGLHAPKKPQHGLKLHVGRS
jgi:site-specific DNA recombinase